MKTHKTYGLLLTAAVMALLLFSCSKKIVNDDATVDSNLRIQVGMSTGFQAIDQFILTISGADFKPITVQLFLNIDGYLYYPQSDDRTDSTLEIPVGRNRLFTIEAFDNKIGGPTPLLVYKGEQRTDVYPGTPINLSIVLKPVIPMIRLAPRAQTQNPLASFPVAVEAYNLPNVKSASLYLDFVSADLDGDSANIGSGLASRVPDLVFDVSNVDDAYYNIYVASGNSNASITDAQGYAELAVIYFTGAYSNGPSTDFFTDLIILDNEGGVVGTDGNSIPIDSIYWDNARAHIIPDFGDDPLLSFPDPDLESAVVEYSGAQAGNIHLSDVFGIENMTWDYHSITDLTGLNQLPNLKIFSIANCNGDVCLSDISGVVGCPKLEYLNLGYNDITDIVPLRDIMTLQYLDLSGNTSLSDIGTLQYMPNLSFVNLSNTAITSLQPLVDNLEFATNDTLDLGCPDFDPSAEVDVLEGRGVTVFWGCK